MMMAHFLFYLYVFIQSLVAKAFLLPILKIISIFSERVARQLELRPNIGSLAQDLASKRRSKKRAYIFFCSSAGEYEQARPLIDRFARQDAFCHVFFFSRSGHDFAKVRGEKSSFSLAPIDSVWNWGPLFAAIQPDWSFIVRHEFWPAFILEAKSWGKLSIIDAVPPSMFGRESKMKTHLSAMSKRFMLRGIHHVFAADHDGADYYLKFIRLDPTRVSCTGDTKYDRVLERVAGIQHDVKVQVDKIKAGWNDAASPVLVVGSAHVPDIDLILNGLSGSLAPKVRLLIVPHDVSSRNVARIYDQLRNAGRKVDTFSEIEEEIHDGKTSEADTLIVDTVGRLSELYAIGDFAWVGGAVHAKVHNVLEPAAWGLPLTCGIHFENSQEARSLVRLGLLVPVADGLNAARAWQQQFSDLANCRQRVRDAVVRLAGASNLIERKVTNSSSPHGCP